MRLCVEQRCWPRCSSSSSCCTYCECSGCRGRRLGAVLSPGSACSDWTGLFRPEPLCSSPFSPSSFTSSSLPSPSSPGSPPPPHTNEPLPVSQPDWSPDLELVPFSGSKQARPLARSSPLSCQSAARGRELPIIRNGKRSLERGSGRGRSCQSGALGGRVCGEAQRRLIQVCGGVCGGDARRGGGGWGIGESGGERVTGWGYVGVREASKDAEVRPEPRKRSTTLISATQMDECHSTGGSSIGQQCRGVSAGECRAGMADMCDH